MEYLRFSPPNKDVFYSHLLDMYGKSNDATLSLRFGTADLAFFKLPRSSRAVVGSEGLIVRNVTLLPKEIEDLKLSGPDPIMIDHLFLTVSMDLAGFYVCSDGDLKGVLALTSAGGKVTRADYDIMYSGHVYLWKVQRSIFSSRRMRRQFRQAREENPNLPVLFIVGHGLSRPDGIKLVGCSDGVHSQDRLDYLLEALKVNGHYCAIIDGTCNENGQIPTLPQVIPPYFSALGDVSLAKQRAVFFKNSQTTICNPE